MRTLDAAEVVNLLPPSILDHQPLTPPIPRWKLIPLFINNTDFDNGMSSDCDLLALLKYSSLYFIFYSRMDSLVFPVRRSHPSILFVDTETATKNDKGYTKAYAR